MTSAQVDYFPLKKGLRLEWRTRNSQGSGLLTLEIVAVEERRGATRATARRTSVWDGRTWTSEARLLREGGWLSVDGEPEFPVPPAAGKSWAVYPRRYAVSALDAEASPPAGSFRGCLLVTYLIAGGDGGGGRRWYAPGVGLVKEECEDEADPYEWALLSFELPTPRP